MGTVTTPIESDGTTDSGPCLYQDGQGNYWTGVCRMCRLVGCSSTGTCTTRACPSGQHRVCPDSSFANVRDCVMNTYLIWPKCPGCASCTCVADGGGGGSPSVYTDPGYCDPSVDPWCSSSPIVIDLKNEGFHLTSVANGAVFDFYGTGEPIKLSWTDPKYGNAWLVLDRNGNGTIDSSLEMFGNLTAQPKSAAPNGYLALAEFDKPVNGGNNNGYIDAGDSVFSKLRLWVDANHDGISQPDELFTLESQGISALDLKYSESRFVDEFGNRFRYQSILVDAKGFHNDHLTYDVFLVVDKAKTKKGKGN